MSASRFQREAAVQPSGSAPRWRFSSMRLKTGDSWSSGALHRPSKWVPPAPGIEEHRSPLPPPLHRPAFFMNQPVMMPAEKHQIRELRLAPLGPVHHMVTFGKAEPTARKPTPPVPNL
jgi:hypothetical protein